MSSSYAFILTDEALLMLLSLLLSLFQLLQITCHCCSVDVVFEPVVVTVVVDFTAHFVPVVVVVVTVVKAAIADFVVAVTCCSNSCILGDVITIFVPHVAVPIPVDTRQPLWQLLYLLVCCWRCYRCVCFSCCCYLCCCTFTCY